MIGVIIPCHNDKLIHDTVARLHRQPCEIFVVLDRITTDLPDYVHVVKNTEGDGFLAGKCRDMGLVEAEKTCDSFIFLDDDCAPQEFIVQAHTEWLDLDIPMITIGRRLEKQYNWRDLREYSNEMSSLGLFDSHGTMFNNASLLKKCMGIWSCNFGINRKAVILVRRMMEMYFDTADRIFSPAFDGKWGGEDSFLSYIAWSCRINMFYLPYGSNAVLHQEHARPKDKYNLDHVDILNKEVTSLSKKLVTEKLTPKFFVV